MTTTFAVVAPGKPSDGAGAPAWQAKMQNAYNRGVRMVTCLLPWSYAQATAGASVSAAVAQVQAYLDAASAVGVQAVLEVGLHLPPAFVVSGVEAFKKQDAVTWAGTAGAGDQVRNWQWTAQGRTYVADLYSKLGASGIAAHPALAGIRLGGGAFGEAEYCPVATSPSVQWWIFGTALQTGAGLASDQVVCPYPGRTPLFNGSDDVKDHAIANWWLNGLNHWMKWLIGQAEGAGFGQGDQKIWVMHASSTGVRDRPHTDAAWINEVARGIAPRRLMGAYRGNVKVFPWALWNDPGTGTTETTMGSATHLLEHARVFEMLDWFADENMLPSSDLDAALTVHDGTSADSPNGAQARVFSVATDDTLNAGAAGDNSWAMYESLIETGTTSNPSSAGPHALWKADAPHRRPIDWGTAVVDNTKLMTTAMLLNYNGGPKPYVAIDDSDCKTYWTDATTAGRLTVTATIYGVGQHTIVCPTGAQPSPTTGDYSFQIVQPDGTFVDLIPGGAGARPAVIAWNGNNGTITVEGYLVLNGTYTTATGWPIGLNGNPPSTTAYLKQGFSACGATSNAGSITPEDKQLGYIAHALEFLFNGNGLANGPVGPATRQDGASGPPFTTYAAGNTYYKQGSLLAIVPPEFGGPAWNPNWSAWETEIVKACCYYGGYVMDRTGGFTIRCQSIKEPGVAVGLTTADFASVMSMANGSVGKFLFDNLRIVTNAKIGCNQGYHS